MSATPSPVGHLVVTVHLRTPFGCEPIVTAVLDPDDVLDLATTLTAASVPPPPVVRRRVRVERTRLAGTWKVRCPECFPLPGAYFNHSSAIAGAYRHLATEHATEMAR